MICSRTLANSGCFCSQLGDTSELSSDWTSLYHWLISNDRITETAEKTEDKTAFLSGGGANKSEIRTVCQKVIWLKTDEETTGQRITRLATYGTRPHELTKAIADNDKKAEYRVYGVRTVDARQPIDIVVEEWRKGYIPQHEALPKLMTRSLRFGSCVLMGD